MKTQIREKLSTNLKIPIIPVFNILLLTIVNGLTKIRVMNNNDKVLRVSGERAGIGMTMGKLEYKVFDAVCKLGKGSVRDILDIVGSGYAYTTVMTTCDRLAKKGILARFKDGNKYLYSPIADRKDMDSQATCKVLESVMSSLTEPVMAGFLDMLEKTDSTKLDMLERMIKERKDNV